MTLRRFRLSVASSHSWLAWYLSYFSGPRFVPVSSPGPSRPGSTPKHFILPREACISPQLAPVINICPSPVLGPTCFFCLHKPRLAIPHHFPCYDLFSDGTLSPRNTHCRSLQHDLIRSPEQHVRQCQRQQLCLRRPGLNPLVGSIIHKIRFDWQAQTNSPIPGPGPCRLAGTVH